MIGHEGVDLGDTFLLEARRDVDQHEGGSVHVIVAHGHEARASAHGGTHERRPSTAERGKEALQVLYHDVLVVTSVRRPVRITVPPRIERNGVVPGTRQPFSSALPRMACL